MPGIKIVEKDESFLPTATLPSAYALIGKADKGPAFIPTLITNAEELYNSFGEFVDDQYAVFAASKVLENTNSVYMSRLLGVNSSALNNGNPIEKAGFAKGCDIGDGGSLGNPAFVNIMSGSTKNNILVLHLKDGYSAVLSGSTNNFENFVLRISGSSTIDYTCSFNSSSINYYKNVLNFDPTLINDKNYYVYIDNGYTLSQITSGTITMSNGTFIDYYSEYTNAETPYVLSQKFGSERHQLFKFVSLHGGEWSNNNIKISINVRKAKSSTTFPTFDVIVRDIYDNDKDMKVLEYFTNCNLDKNSDNYICKKIGDKYLDINGDEYGNYDNKSRYIRVVVNDTIIDDSDLAIQCYPVAFGIYDKLGTANFGTDIYVAKLPYIHSQKIDGGFYYDGIYWGLPFNASIYTDGCMEPSLSFYGDEFLDRFKMLPIIDYKSGSNVIETNANYIDNVFSLENLSCSTGAISAPMSDTDKRNVVYNIAGGNIPLQYLLDANLGKFTFGFYGGFDGFNIHKSDPYALDHDDSNLENSVIGTALLKAIEFYKDINTYDIMFISAPGYSNPVFISRLVEVAEKRKDCIAIVDINDDYANDARVTNMVEDSLGMPSSSYYAKYAPRLKIYNDNSYIEVPSTCGALYTLAYSAKNAFPWSAPAGELRGTLPWANNVVINFKNEEDRVKLYDANINLILRFANNANRRIMVWGQKTGQIEESALDRLNVKLLRIYLAKEIVKATRWMVFEGNNPQTWDSFRNICRPIFEYVKQNGGVEYIYAQMDSDTNTQTVIENNEMKGRIVFKPVYVAEEITLEFVISNKSIEVK